MVSRNPEYTLAEDVENLIRDKTYVSMVDIMNLAGDEGMGEGRMVLGDDNVVVWADMSEELVDAITSLRANKLIHMHDSNPWIYLMDGGKFIDIPNWIPVVFQPGFRCTTDPQCPNWGRG